MPIRKDFAYASLIVGPCGTTAGALLGIDVGAAAPHARITRRHPTQCAGKRMQPATRAIFRMSDDATWTVVSVLGSLAARRASFKDQLRKIVEALPPRLELMGGAGRLVG